MSTTRERKRKSAGALQQQEAQEFKKEAKRRKKLRESEARSIERIKAPLNKRIEELGIEKTDLEDKNRDLQFGLSQAQAEVRRLKAMLENQERGADGLLYAVYEDQLAGLEKENQTLREELAQEKESFLNEEIKYLGSSIEQQDEIRKLKNENEQLLVKVRVAISSDVSKHLAREKVVAAQREQIKELNEELKKQIAINRDQVVKLFRMQEENEKLRLLLQSSKEERSKQKEVINKLQEEVEGKKELLEKLQEHVELLDWHYTHGAKQLIGTLSDEVLNLDVDKSEQQAIVQQLKVKNKEQSETIQGLQEENSKLVQYIEAANAIDGVKETDAFYQDPKQREPLQFADDGRSYTRKIFIDPANPTFFAMKLEVAPRKIVIAENGQNTGGEKPASQADINHTNERKVIRY